MLRTSSINARDGTQLYIKDWGEGQPVVFSHGWPLTSDDFEDAMFFLAARGFRCIAHDRRGHGRSAHPWQGNDMDTYADDLATLAEELGLRHAVLVGHCMGGGEAVRYLARHGSRRIEKMVLIAAVPPYLRKPAAEDIGAPLRDPSGALASILQDRIAFMKHLAIPFFGFNRPGANISESVRDSFLRQAMMASLPACYVGLESGTATDFTDDLLGIEVPTLVLHGDDDQLVPLETSSRLSSQLLKNARLKVYEGGSHGLHTTRKDEVHADLLAFLTEGSARP